MGGKVRQLKKRRDRYNTEERRYEDWVSRNENKQNKHRKIIEDVNKKCYVIMQRPFLSKSKE